SLYGVMMCRRPRGVSSPEVPMANILRSALCLTFLVLISGRLHAAQGDAPKRPNILFIYTDDQSHRTVSCYPEAHSWARTPNIDRLVKMGVRFTAAYNGSWCAPSRASILTG